MYKTTGRHKKYWIDRKIDWKKAYFNPEHPHRRLMVEALRDTDFRSLFEVGCAAGANLYNIQRAYPHAHIGGMDISEDAIETAKKILPNHAVFEVGSLDSIFMSDKCVDVTIADMTLIYLSPLKIKQALKELIRITRNNLVFCEFHHTNWFKRQALRLASGYNAYNYEKKLEKLGCYDIEIRKIKPEEWPGGEPQKTFGYIIRAKIV
ncbi:hypothetical protein CMI37_11635 [Candidatus Pacearchaeota archaeon]|nr:hypothetical protein [Candidatus Pacearchaeota archaeon]|tara:strand:+ start:49 stop:669 length:621 start_codon:yes stop_codon:yes gene_type:complete